MKTITAYTEGTSTANPGPASIQVRIMEGNKIRSEISESIGNATSSYAEYVAVLRALEVLTETYGSRTTEMRFNISVKTESVKRQLSGELPVVEPGLVPHFMAIHNMRVASFPFLNFSLTRG